MRGSFYIASSRDGLADVATLAMHLENHGMRNAFPWHMHFNHVCSPGVCDVADRKDLARREIEAASSCDLFVGVSRLGRGSHVELGAALAKRSKRVLLVGVDPADSVFYEAGEVEVVASIADVMRALVDWEPPDEDTIAKVMATTGIDREGAKQATFDGKRLAQAIITVAGGNRRGNDDSIPRCTNTNAAGVCMYSGPCLECTNARGKERARTEKIAKLTLGTVVHVRGFRKGVDRAHVVVAGPREGLVKLAYCATERWYMAKWYAIEFVITEVSDNNPHVRRARRWIAKITADADGCKRIQTGRFGQPGGVETVGHVDLTATDEVDEANSNWRDWT